MHVRPLARLLASTRALPPRAALFQARAMLRAARLRDDWALQSSTRPADVGELIRLARGRRNAVELGTATGWTSVAFAIADERRRVRSYDPEVRPERERYIALAGPARERIELEQQRAEEARPEPRSAGLLFIDCAHDRETTRDAFRAFEAAVQPGGAVAFHDYGHPRYPGVFQAVEELGLRGVVSGGMFIWRKPHA